MRELFEGLDGLATLIAVSCSIPITLFVLFYAKRSDWRSTDAGRALMYQSVAMLTILGIVILSLIFPGYPGRHIVRVIGYSFLAFTLWRTFAVLLSYQNSYQAQKDKDTKADDLILRTRWAMEREQWLQSHDAEGKRIDPNSPVDNRPLQSAEDSYDSDWD